MIKKMTNAEIYGLSKALSAAFNNEEKYLPARVNFYIQKNKNLLSQLNESIEITREHIITHYGTLNEEGTSYNIPPENINEVNKELQDLLNVEQEVQVSMIYLSDLDGLDFTSKQMQALLFMIEEN